MRRSLAVSVIAFTVLSMAGARADEGEPRYPVPEIGVLNPEVAKVVSKPCVMESAYDTPSHYGADCVRLQIAFGPILVKPGQNDVLIQPVTFEKPMWTGKLVRFKPNLIDPTGIAPPVDELHLHHGTWLNAGREYGDGPWIASGEEKTIAAWPKGFGLEIQSTDQWLFLHMVHNAVSQPRAVWVTYDLDMIPSAAATTHGIKNTKQIWLDVGGGNFMPQGYPSTDTYLLNPIYNVQRGFGTFDAESGRLTCTWPDQNCARYNSEGNASPQQGKPYDDVVHGMDETISASFAGTLVVMGGHLHTGGIRDEVYVVRDVNKDGHYSNSPEEQKLIHVSDAYYWSPTNPSQVGGAPTSWDFSMTGVSRDIGWSVNVQPGDKIRLNAVYDSQMASWYENMGIVMTWVAPGEFFGVDPFSPDTVISRGIPTTATTPANVTATCEPGLRSDGKTVLCTRGQVTHPHYASSNRHGVCQGEISKGGTCPDFPTTMLPDGEGPMVDSIHMAGFQYGIADLGSIAVNGVPRVRLGEPLTFVNEDAGAYIWHTATTCAFPCTGSTTVDYPIANGGNGSPDDVMDFDTSELGIGAGAAQRLDWEFTPTRTGIFTFYCRIHPGMRGAFEVVE